MASSIQIFRDAKQMREYSREQRRQGKRIGFVPTMGSLHEGHLNLVRTAEQSCDVIIVSIYVNPTQFSKNEDFGVYPRHLEADMSKLTTTGCTAVFAPSSLYHTSTSSLETNKGDNSMVSGAADEGSIDRDAHCTWVEVDHLTTGLCAASRPHHFRGVTTIVTKLFNIVEPDQAFFGKKDYQQWRVIRRMARDLDFGIDIIGVPIVRETDGLAMSSRNALLTPENRQAAPCIYKSLEKARERLKNKEIVAANEVMDEVKSGICGGGGKVDYVELVVADTLETVTANDLGSLKTTVVIVVAAFFGTVRLLDNMEIEL